MAKKTLTDDILNMDYQDFIKIANGQNFDALKSVANRLFITANRRINALKKSDIGDFSPALLQLEKADIKKFNTKELKNMTTKEYNNLISNIYMAKKFLKSKSSTVKGWEKIRNDINKRVGGGRGLFATTFKSERAKKLAITREKKFWGMYNRLIDEYGGILTQLDSYRIQKMLKYIQTMRNQAKTTDDIMIAMRKYISDLYEKGSVNDVSYLKALKDEQTMNEIRLEYGNI